jgi:hypothetical protein
MLSILGLLIYRLAIVAIGSGTTAFPIRYEAVEHRLVVGATGAHPLGVAAVRGVA